MTARPGRAQKKRRRAVAPPRSQPEHVVAISVDALASAAISTLGRDGAPTLWRLLDEGASTLNARTAYEANVTLPNHVGMITGRVIARDAGGHGVTWNDDRPHDTLQVASGDPGIESIFSAAHAARLSTAIFAGKDKFDIFTASWPESFDHWSIREDRADSTATIDAAAQHLVATRPALTFLHVAAPDAEGHASGGMTPAYLRSVREVDTDLGRLLAAVEADPALRQRTLIVLTADHGVTAGATTHSAHTAPNYTIPFMIWGAGVTSGDLYAHNPRRAEPGTARPTYSGPQPVRNLDLAGVVTAALRLRPIGEGPMLAYSVGVLPMEGADAQ